MFCAYVGLAVTTALALTGGHEGGTEVRTPKNWAREHSRDRTERILGKPCMIQSEGKQPCGRATSRHLDDVVLISGRAVQINSGTEKEGRLVPGEVLLLSLTRFFKGISKKKDAVFS